MDDNKHPPFGVYLTPTGNLRYFYQKEVQFPQQGSAILWHIDEGKKSVIRIGNFKTSIAVEFKMSIGWPVLEERACLKGCEYLGEL